LLPLFKIVAFLNIRFAFRQKNPGVKLFKQSRRRYNCCMKINTLKSLFLTESEDQNQPSEEEVLGTYILALGSIMILIVLVLFLAQTR